VSKRTFILLLALLASLSFHGCVYYNTFYHAQLASEEAEALRKERPPGSQPSSTEMELYERVVEKAGRVVRKHSDTKWVDDALLLMGTALYHQGKYESAEQRLTELITTYPESDLRTEAEYMLASVKLAKGSAVSAEQLLLAIATADPPHELSDDALILIGETLRARGLYGEAAEAYVDALGRFPDSDLRARAHYFAAENYMEIGDLPSAVRHFAEAATERGSTSILFDARMRMAEAGIELGQFETSLEVIDDLEARTDDRDNLDEVLLLRGRAFETMGDLPEAIETYEGVVAAHARSPAAAEAYYRIGLIQRDEMEDLEQAKEFFDKAREEAARSDAGQLALEASRDIEELSRHLAVIAASEEAPEAMAEGEAPAEDQGPSERERVEGEAGTGSIVDTTHTEMLPVTPLPGEAGELSPTDPDTLGAVAPSSGEVVADAADTTRAAADALADQGPAEDAVADARFHAAELYLFSLGDHEKALEQYRVVVEEHPESAEAPSAAFAIAWTHENVSADSMAAAAAYRVVVDEYPMSDQAAAAREWLGLPPLVVEEEVAAEEVGPPSPPDTLAAGDQPPSESPGELEAPGETVPGGAVTGTEPDDAPSGPADAPPEPDDAPSESADEPPEPEEAGSEEPSSP
jgi:TolA-binding protein